MKFRVVVEKDKSTDRWSAVFPEVPGCASAGDTEAEAVENAREALALWLKPSKIKFPSRARILELSVP